VGDIRVRSTFDPADRGAAGAPIEVESWVSVVVRETWRSTGRRPVLLTDLTEKCTSG
jgi:hypothetical protein